MSRTAIEVNNVGKKYRVGEFTGGSYRDLRDVIVDSFARLFKRRPAVDNVQEFWALRNINLQVQQGDRLALIGRNGSGKSTFLKLLSRITEPTEGKLRYFGTVASLLEVGTGFHPDLTGRENVYLNGAILGMTRRDIRKSFDEIVAFSGVEKFIDTPVKRYSSGMYVRLAFAVAAHLRSEILLVDEVLAVGDRLFQQKCLDKMEDVSKEGRTVLLVTHNMQAAQSLCNRAILLRSGELVAEGPTRQVITAYYEDLREIQFDATSEVQNPRVRRGTGAVRFSELIVKDEAGRVGYDHPMGSTILFELGFEVFQPVERLHLKLVLNSGKTGECVTNTHNLISESPLEPGSQGTVTLALPKVSLRPGEYPLYFWLGDQYGAAFDVVDGATLPLIIFCEQPESEVEFDPAQPAGYFNIPNQVVSVKLS